ncbi:hypothetical protein [Saccharothrix sp. ST-888]|uniref:hypothetical protein n=1 Tax=Saccharothrix sp. ST-888 TaxID=1427391 RepID=UPI0012E09C85|nr:hypothetical protein [Saccharothrix sp. ST-888]
MPRIPLICPRCGRPQRVVPSTPDRTARVVHAETGREECEPADLADGAAGVDDGAPATPTPPGSPAPPAPPEPPTPPASRSG